MCSFSKSARERGYVRAQNARALGRACVQKRQELAHGVLSLRDVAEEPVGQLQRFELPLEGLDGRPAGDLLLTARVRTRV